MPWVSTIKYMLETVDHNVHFFHFTKYESKIFSETWVVGSLYKTRELLAFQGWTTDDQFSFQSNYFTLLAPPGCLQYFYEDFGLVQSFNFGGDYYGDTQYAICFNKGKKLDANLE